MVSALIGKQGAKIKEVTASTGGNMQFAKEVNHNFPETKPDLKKHGPTSKTGQTTNTAEHK